MTASEAAPGDSDRPVPDEPVAEEAVPSPRHVDPRLMKKQGNDLMIAGLSVGAVGVLGAVIGAACPLCVVATPALLGAGAVRRWQAHRREERESSAAREPAK